MAQNEEKAKNKNSCSILLVDDHPLFRSGLAATFDRQEINFQIYQAGSLAEAQKMLSEKKIELMFLDINLEDGNGIQFLKELRSPIKNGLKIVMLSMYQDAALVNEAMELGASGYLSKDATEAEIMTATENILMGKSFFNSSIINSISETNSSVSLLKRLGELTPAEMRILWHVSQSKSSKQIAKELRINYRTVENHRTKICGKLGISGSHGLVRFALNKKKEIAKYI